jgi:hypothetical protein
MSRDELLHAPSIDATSAHTVGGKFSSRREHPEGVVLTLRRCDEVRICVGGRRHSP